jgi:hypothetical protein
MPGCLQGQEGGAAGPAAVVPVTLLLLDVSGPEEWLELLQSSLAVLADALDPGSLCGIIGISHCISLLDMGGG